MRRKTYVIEAENGVGLYFSECLMENSFEYLSHFDRRILSFDTFEAAKQYVFYKYENDGEIDLEKFRVNFTIMRDYSRRCYFYVQSKKVIGYGIDEEMKNPFQYAFHVGSSIIETDSKWAAEQGARYGFVEEYGEPAYYYGGILLPGESVSFAKMLHYNRICCNYSEMEPKLHEN